MRHIKIYPPCNFEVNPITYFGVISLFSSNFQNFNTFRPLFQKLKETGGKLKLQTCSACQDLPTLQFWSKFDFLSWSYCPFKIVSVSTVLYPRWPPLLKIEISSNGQNCSILSQKVPKFKLYKHNDELFNIYYGIFYELWTFAYFDRLCKLEKRGDEI